MTAVFLVLIKMSVATPTYCGSELARDSDFTFNINVD